MIRFRFFLKLIALASVSLVVLSSCIAPITPVSQTEAAAEDLSTEATSTEAEVAEENTAEASTDDSGLVEVEFLPEESPPFGTGGWETDFTQRIVEWSEILSGGPPKDGIPAIDVPEFESIADAANWLGERDPVIAVQHNGETRAYPLAVLIWHEIVNDEVGGKPISITFCPLCNASIAFDREFDGQILDFGTTGRLRRSDLVMYDRQTETWWQQFTGQGIIGKYAGQQLRFLPSQVISFSDFSAEFPDSMVLARPSSFNRAYGSNPYARYDSTEGRPFLYRGELDERLSSTERVVGVEAPNSTGAVMAYPFSVLAEIGVVNDELGDTAIVVFHKSGTASALDAQRISEGKDIGSVGVFERQLGDQMLTFANNEDGTFTDAETGSTWNILGEAIDGELTGQQLMQVISFDHFWFAWASFFPDTGLFEG